LLFFVHEGHILGLPARFRGIEHGVPAVGGAVTLSSKFIIQPRETAKAAEASASM